MRASGITKAASHSLCAVIASVVLIASVAQSAPSARVAATKQKPAIVVADANVAPVVTPKPLPHAAAKPRLVADAIPLIPPSPLLPIVDQASIHPEQQVIADTVLRKLPDLCRNNLKNFYVRYDNPEQRGLGGRTTIIVNGSEGKEEFAGLITHECGHVISGNLLGNPVTGASTFKDGGDIFAKDSPAAAFFAISWTTEKTAKKTNRKEDFVTGYASSDAFEDFAETFATYVLQRPSMEERALTNTAIAAKLEWMKTNLPLPEKLLGTPLYKWDKKVPWDATRLAYIWNPQL